MRRFVLVSLALVLVACGQPVAAATARNAAAADPARNLRLFTLDKGFLFPLANGGQVALANGWIEPRLSPYPPARHTELDVVVYSAASRSPAAAEVFVDYEMLEMAHGATKLRAEPGAAGHNATALDLSMYGTWQVRIRVVLDGVSSDVTLVLAESGQ